ncbi:MAG: MBL fold metallo-hydrolase [Ignisphaera sp.]|uniref:MBL fold metallo-hydrolase n=1 Tax=Ignisphaera aggregans TaxID=334771 RepID=A0A7J3N0J9_9CREN
MKITVLGAGREVGRTAILLSEANGSSSLLLDYGISFDEYDKPVFPLSVAPSQLKAVLVTHAHLDHIGAAPLLYVSAKPLLIATNLTLVAGKLMIEDMLRLSGYYLPFEYPELATMLENSKAAGINETVELNGVSIELLNAGHIPGSAMFRIHTKNRTIIYTGDINTIDTKLVKGVDPTNMNADVIIMESTYGMFNHPPRNRVEEKFVETIKSVLDEGGSVLIPSFSLGRAQEILAVLADRMPYTNVYYDGMAREILSLYLEQEEYINRIDLLRKAYTLFESVRSSQMRKKICSEPGNIIVAPAGMLKGGPAVYYIKRLGFNSRNAVILVSFQATTTPGRKLLVDGSLEENGQPVNAKVFWFDFSSHAGSEELMNIIKSVKNIEKVVLVHGSEDAIYTIGYRIREELGIEFYAPKNGETIEI